MTLFMLVYRKRSPSLRCARPSCFSPPSMVYCSKIVHINTLSPALNGAVETERLGESNLYRFDSPSLGTDATGTVRPSANAEAKSDTRGREARCSSSADGESGRGVLPFIRQRQFAQVQNRAHGEYQVQEQNARPSACGLSGLPG